MLEIEIAWDGAGGTRDVIRSPYRMSETDTSVVGPAGHLGEHNSAVLGSWLDKDGDDVEALTAAGVLVQDDWARAAEGKAP